MATTISSTSGTSGTLSANGVGSGLDISGLVSKLMDVENLKLAGIDNQKSAYQTKVSAYGQVKSVLAQFQSALASLKNASAMATTTVQSSDWTTVGASTGTGAAAGSYNVKVTQLAKASKLASQGFAAVGDSVGTGTLTFDFGTYDAGGNTFLTNGNGAKSVTIGTGQDSLAGIRDAVNAANIGVTATIVNDGSAAGNRLVFTSATTGAANSMKITVTDDDGTARDNAGLSRLAFDPTGTAGAGRNLDEKVAAQDAKLTIDDIPISKPSNLVTDALQGVTLSLLKETTGTGATLTVAADTASPAKAVSDFVTAYNGMVAAFTSLTKYDPTTKKGSVLTGDSLVRSVQTQISSILGRSVGGLPNDGTTTSTLRQAGITLNADGTLKLDAGKLATAAKSADGIARLFGAVGKASDSGVKVTGSGTATTAKTYTLSITQAATQGNVTGSAAVADTTIVAGVNDTLDVTLDGVAATVTLAAGTYASIDALAAEVQTKINGASAIAGAGARVTVANGGGTLAITSAVYGSSSAVAIAGSGALNLLGAAPVVQAGQDVAGFIDGVQAAGSGQTLTAASGSAAEGLVLAVTGSNAGERGTVVFSRGYAAQLDSVIADVLSSKGAVASRTDGINRSLTDLDKQRTAMAARLAKVEATYKAQFNALDTLLGKMQTTSSYLTQQLAAIKANSGSGN